MIEVVVKAENLAGFSIHDQGGIGSYLSVGEVCNKANFRPSVSIVRASLERDVNVAGVLKIPGGVAAGIDYREEISVLCRDDCGNPEVLGAPISLGENHLAKSIGKKGVVVGVLVCRLAMEMQAGEE